MKNLIRAFAGGDTLFHQSVGGLSLFTEEGAAAEEALTVEMMRVKDWAGDVLICRTWDGLMTQGTVEISVALPWELRPSTFDGKTYDLLIEDEEREKFSYTFDKTTGRRISKRVSDDNDEEQAIIPHYQKSFIVDGVDQDGNPTLTIYPLDVIYAVKPINGTGIDGVEYQDLNVAGRAWGEIAT